MNTIQFLQNARILSQIRQKSAKTIFFVLSGIAAVLVLVRIFFTNFPLILSDKMYSIFEPKFTEYVTNLSLFFITVGTIAYIIQWYHQSVTERIDAQIKSIEKEGK